MSMIRHNRLMFSYLTCFTWACKWQQLCEVGCCVEGFDSTNSDCLPNSKQLLSIDYLDVSFGDSLWYIFSMGRCQGYVLCRTWVANHMQRLKTMTLFLAVSLQQSYLQDIWYILIIKLLIHTMKTFPRIHYFDVFFTR